MEPEIKYRLANESDIPAIAAFVDFWLAGRGLADQVPGSAHDYFVPAGRHLKYVTKYVTLIALLDNYIIGWSVKTHLGVLIHLLVAGTFRHQEIGSKMLKLMDPQHIRSKMDQSAGNPAQFYADRGYVKSKHQPITEKHNIELFTRARNFCPTSSSPAHSAKIAGKPHEIRLEKPDKVQTEKKVRKTKIKPKNRTKY